MHSPPKITVITATYNDEAYLGMAMDSILSQSFGDFEYILVDDASTDNTAQILATYASADPRITVYRNDRNLGRAASRNRALELSRGQWIAIFDGDDISAPNRLASQLAYLHRHPEVDYLGTCCNHIDKKSGVPLPERTFRPPLSHGQICWHLCFSYPFHHTSTIGRRELINRAGGYPPTYPVCEDIYLWMSLARLGAHFANLEDELVTYRVNTTPRYYDLHQIIAEQLHRRYISDLLHAQVAEDVFNLIRQSNFKVVSPPLATPGALKAVESIRMLTDLYEKLTDQKDWSAADADLVQSDLIERVDKILRIVRSSRDSYVPVQHSSYMYSYSYALLESSSPLVQNIHMS